MARVCAEEGLASVWVREAETEDQVLLWEAHLESGQTAVDEVELFSDTVPGYDTVSHEPSLEDVDSMGVTYETTDGYGIGVVGNLGQMHDGSVLWAGGPALSWQEFIDRIRSEPVGCSFLRKDLE